MAGVRLSFCVVLLASCAFAQELTPPPAPPPEEPPPAQRSVPPEALRGDTPAVKYNPGWAREGGALGFGVSVVPVGLAVAAGVTQWSSKGANGKYDLTLSDTLIICAGVSAPVMALIPTFAGRSAVVADDLAHAPRLLRILGWIMVGFATIDLVTTPLYEKAFGLVFGDGPSVFTAITDVIAGVLAAGGIVVLSIAARRSATRSEMPSEEVGPPATVFAPTVMPSFAVVPGAHGGGAALAGFTGTW